MEPLTRKAQYGLSFSGTKADHNIFTGFAQTKAGLLNFLANFWHVSHSPRHNHELRLRKSRMNLFQKMPIAFPEDIIEELLLKTWRWRVIQQLHKSLDIHSF